MPPNPIFVLREENVLKKKKAVVFSVWIVIGFVAVALIQVSCGDECRFSNAGESRCNEKGEIEVCEPGSTAGFKGGWKAVQSCTSIGMMCSSYEGNCGGLLNSACCIPIR